MAQRTKVVESEIEVGQIGALPSYRDKKDHSFHLIEWTTLPYILQKEKNVFGIDEPVAAGNIVCEGICWSKVDQTTNWYEPQENHPKRKPKKIVVMLTHVLSGKLSLKPYKLGLMEPAGMARISLHNKLVHFKLQQLGKEEFDILKKEQDEREDLELAAVERIAPPKPRKPKEKAKGKKGAKKTEAEKEVEEIEEHEDEEEIEEPEDEEDWNY